MGGPTKKNAISRDFWHFSNFDVFLKGEQRGIQNLSGTSQLAVVPEIWPLEVSISLENMRDIQTKKCDFLNYWFSGT